MTTVGSSITPRNIPRPSVIAPPENRAALIEDVYSHPVLDTTADGKKIFLIRYASNSPAIREIGRLREVSFRAVGEGTGRERDLDRYDIHYRHIVLWDDEDLEIVGAYRVGESGPILEAHGLDGLYTSSLFSFEPGILRHLNYALELGRSFVQPRYWGRRSLDYLWYGIGAFLRTRPEIRYLFGPVTISAGVPPEARDLLIRFYQIYFPFARRLARANNPFALLNDPGVRFTGQDYKREFKVLKHRLRELGSKVPALYKQYTELCEPGGAQFLDFGFDPDFADCIDGLVLIDTRLIKPKKWDRYVGDPDGRNVRRAA